MKIAPRLAGLSLRQKVLFALIGASLATVLVALTAWFSIRTFTEQITEIGHRRMVALENILTAAGNIRELNAKIRDAIGHTATVRDREQRLAEIQAARTIYRKAIEDAGAVLDADELQELVKLQREIAAWRAANDKIFAQIDALNRQKIDAPLLIQRDLEAFRGDHLKLLADADRHLQAGTTYSGATDPSACRFGRWLSTYQTENEELRTAMARTAGPHTRLHHAIRDFQQALAASDADSARTVLRTKIAPAVEETLVVIGELQTSPDKAVATLNDARRIADEEAVPLMNAALATLDSFVTELRKHANEAVHAADEFGQRASRFSAIASIGGIALAFGIGLFIAHRLSRQLQELAASMSSGAAETSQVAGQIANSSQEVAKAASAQAAALEETSASLEELLGTTRQNTERAQHSTERATQARTSAEQGAEQMRELQEAMNAIRQSSGEITKVVKTIDEIAFQTNILALNAAVEAARAGEAGAGFAVVADEVRALAQRSATAAKETAALVESAASRSGRGVTLATDVSGRLQEILEHNRVMDSLVAEIAAASREQHSGVDQIRTATTQLDTLTQTNAAHSEENASASEELQSQTVSMREMAAELLSVVTGRRETHAEVGAAAHAAPVVAPKSTKPKQAAEFVNSH